VREGKAELGEPIAITSPVTVLEPNGKLLPEIPKVASSPSMVNDSPGTSELITPVQVVVSAAAARWSAFAAARRS
jgi:hypothetical protein